MVERKKVVRPIRNAEDLVKCEECLNRYMTEYEWLHNNPDPLMSIKQKALKHPITSEARNSLNTRARLIETGQYEVALERNITSYLLAIEEYRAKEKLKEELKEGKKSFYDIVMGIIKKDKDTMEYLEKRYMKSKAEKAGIGLAYPEDLDLQSKEDVLTQVFEECDFVRIEKPVNALVAVNVENKMFAKVHEALSEYLKKNGIEVDNNSKKVDSVENSKRDFYRGNDKQYGHETESTKGNIDKEGIDK